MAILYQPEKIIAKMAPASKIEKLVTQRFTLNRVALKMITRSGVISKESLTDTALSVLRSYRNRFKNQRSEGLSITEATKETLQGKALMVQRVQNTVVFEIAKGIHKTYRGERYVWLPSSAEEPDPLHQLNYGMRFWVGEGEMPGDRYGCLCGMRILVDEEELEL